MDGTPLLIRPEDTEDFIALGSAGVVWQGCSNPDQVIKAPLKHDVKGCSQEAIKSAKHDEHFSELCLGREKLVYQTLPRHSHILEFLDIGDRGLQFPYHRLGNLRDYLLKSNGDIPSQLRDQWINNAVDAIAVVHTHGVVHADISPRNFLVADDLSIKLCDFAGSVIGDRGALVEEEDRYNASPRTPRCVQTDLFALGSLIYEISTGLRPYDEIPDSDDEEVQKRYAAQIFPCLDGFKYREIISKCWSFRYASIGQLRSDLDRCVAETNKPVEPSGFRRCWELFPLANSGVTLALGVLGVGYLLWFHQKHLKHLK
jgi:serine/threonine protein kinase